MEEGERALSPSRAGTPPARAPSPSTHHRLAPAATSGERERERERERMGKEK